MWLVSLLKKKKKRGGGEFGDRCIQEESREDEGIDRSDASTNQGMPMITSEPPQAEGEA